MREQYITICRDCFSSSNSHALQHLNKSNNKYYVPKFTISPMVVSLYDS